MVYVKELIGKKVKINDEEIEIKDEPIFYKWIQFAEHKLAGQKKKTLEKQNNPDCKLPYEDIIKKYNITAEDVFRNLKSTYSVYEKHIRQSDVDITNVKLSDVRKMSLNITNLESYTESEREYINSRLSEYERDYDIEKAADKFKAIRAIVCEMKILQLELLLANKIKGDSEIQKQIDALDKQHAFHCDGLNVLKKQRDNAKIKPVDDTISISKLVNDMSKPIDELQKEADELKQKKEKFLKERNKRK